MAVVSLSASRGSVAEVTVRKSTRTSSNFGVRAASRERGVVLARGKNKGMRTGRGQSSGARTLACSAALAICSQFLVRSQSVDTTTLGAIDREALHAPMGYAWLAWSTRTIGHRLTGTENGRRAEESADSLFRAAGIQDVVLFP